MKIKINEGNPITFFVRISGPKGSRELRAVLDTGSTYCTIPVVDARELGYDAFYDPLANKGDGALALTQAGILDIASITLKDIKVAELSAADVPALAYELPRMSGVDMVLGLSFLQHFKITIDFHQGLLAIENP
jgi:predicted aspartyl protease